MSLQQRLREQLQAYQRVEHEIPGLRRAAVLAPLFERDGEARLLFTLRSADLRSHSGQVSFPGGRVDDDDADLVATAVREAEEEVGIDPKSVTVLGLLSDIPTPAGYVVTPVVGWLDPPPGPHRLNPAEVSEAFEIAVARLAVPGSSEVLGEVERWGVKFVIRAWKLDGKNIWGATAHMVAELLEVMAMASRPQSM